MALPSNWQSFLAAIRAQESSGNYNQDSAGCLGAYCWSAQSIWADMAKTAGESQYADQNPSQVPADIQDKVASANLYRIYQQEGGGTSGFDAAARWWNGGETGSVPNPGLPQASWAPQCGGGNTQAYACQVMTRMRLGGHYLAGAGSGAGGTVLTAASSADAVANCLIGWGGVQVGGIQNYFLAPLSSFFHDLPFGIGSGTAKGIASGESSSNVGGFCLVSKSQARAIAGAASIAAGAVIMGVGLAFTITLTAPRSVLAIAMPVSRAFAGGGAAPRESGPGKNLRPDEIKQAQANRRQLAKAQRAQSNAAGP